ncbi:hypothetical protein YC2023_089249 [Brassica napus]
MIRKVIYPESFILSQVTKRVGVSQRHLEVAPAGSEVMGATPRSRSRFRRCLEKTITSERGLGARSKGRSSWERRYGSDTLTSLAISTERALKN